MNGYTEDHFCPVTGNPVGNMDCDMCHMTYPDCKQICGRAMVGIATRTLGKQDCPLTGQLPQEANCLLCEYESKHPECIDEFAIDPERFTKLPMCPRSNNFVAMLFCEDCKYRHHPDCIQRYADDPKEGVRGLDPMKWEPRMDQRPAREIMEEEQAPLILLDRELCCPLTGQLPQEANCLLCGYESVFPGCREEFATDTERGKRLPKCPITGRIVALMFCGECEYPPHPDCLGAYADDPKRKEIVGINYIEWKPMLITKPARTLIKEKSTNPPQRIRVAEDKDKLTEEGADSRHKLLGIILVLFVSIFIFDINIVIIIAIIMFSLGISFLFRKNEEIKVERTINKDDRPTSLTEFLMAVNSGLILAHIRNPELQITEIFQQAYDHDVLNIPKDVYDRIFKALKDHENKDNENDQEGDSRHSLEILYEKICNTISEYLDQDDLCICLIEQFVPMIIISELPAPITGELLQYRFPKPLYKRKKGEATFRTINKKLFLHAGRFDTKPAAHAASKEWFKRPYHIAILPCWINLKRHWDLWIRNKELGVYVEAKDIEKAGVEKQGWH